MYLNQKVIDMKKIMNKLNLKLKKLKGQEVKKHDYYIKLSSTKKSLDNVIKEREVLEKLHKQNIRKTKDKYLIESINFWFDLINSDLEGTQEDIIKKVENNESKVVKEVDKNTINNSINNPLYLPILNIKKYDDQIRSLSRDKKSNLKKSNIKKHKNITININDLSITSRLNIKQNLSLSSSRKGKKTDIFKEKLKKKKLMLNKKSNSILMRTENNELNDISFEYELTDDNEYRELLNKKDEYVKMINKLEESIKEAQKVSNGKSKHISNIIHDNSNKLEGIRTNNLLIQKEIEKLEHVYQLTKKQFEKQIQENEIEIIKYQTEKKKKNSKNSQKKKEISNSKSTENLKCNKFDLEEDIIPEKEKIELEEIPEENKIKSIERETNYKKLAK